MRERWWILPLTCILAALPFGAAFWVYGDLSPWIEVTPGVFVSSGRDGIWVLPTVNAALTAVLYPVTNRGGKRLEKAGKAAERETDIMEVLPWIRAFLAAWLTAVCLAVIYGYHIQDAGSVTGDLIGRVSAFALGAGTALFALGLPHATKRNVLALRFVYTERSLQVWLRVHTVGARVLYVTGTVMIVLAVLLRGFWAAGAAGLALFSALVLLYLFAKGLYEDEFRSL